MEGLDPKVVEQLLASLKEAYALGGWLAVVPVALVAIMNVYKLPALQGLLPEKVRWDRLSGKAQMGIVFGVALAGGVATNLAGGVGLVAAVVTAIGGAIAASLGHSLLLKPMAKATTDAASRMPNALGAAASIIVPYKADELQAARDARVAK